MSFGEDQVGSGSGRLYWFFEKHLEIVKDKDTNVKTQSEGLIIYKSRWDEIIESLEGGYGMTDEEAEIVKSVLKNNVPFNVVEVSDPVIAKVNQTHLDATHIGDTGNAALYYKSELLKKWFWWNESVGWEECDFIWSIDNESQLFPITIKK